MKIDHLRYFVTLSDYMSITKTSHVLQTTPQNTSRILKSLESELNTILFTRDSDGVKFTQDGEQFLRFCKNTIYQYDLLNANIQHKQSQQNIQQSITLYSNNAINEVILNKILTAFSVEYPALTIKNHLVSWRQGLNKIAESNEDIAFLFYLNKTTIPEHYLYVPALKLHPIAIMNKTHPLAHLKECHQSQLLKYSFAIFSNDDISNTVFSNIINLSEKKDTITQLGNINAIYTLISNSDYIGFSVAEAFVELKAQIHNKDIRDSLITLPIIEFPYIECVLIKPANLSNKSPQQLLFSYILDNLQKSTNLV